MSHSMAVCPPASPRRRRAGVLMIACTVAGGLLSGCAATDSAGAEDSEVRVPTEPIDEVALHADPAGQVSLGAGATTVSFSWAGLLKGTPVTHHECVGMVSLTSPDGHLIHFDPSLKDCSGQAQLPLDPTADTGDYRVNVMLNGLNTTLFYPVLP